MTDMQLTLINYFAYSVISKAIDPYIIPPPVLLSANLCTPICKSIDPFISKAIDLLYQ